MSSFIAIVSDEEAFIVTDTVSHVKKDNSVLYNNYCTKTFYLPHLKCCYAVQGEVVLGTLFLSFVNEYVIACDVHSLVNAIREGFQTYIKTSVTKTTNGTVLLIGVNNATKKLEQYTIEIKKSTVTVNIQTDQGVQMKPSHGIDATFLAQLKYNSYMDLLIQLMKEQKKRDDTSLERVVIGGQIQFTYISNIDNKFLIQVQLPFTFDEYESIGTEMLLRSQKK